MERYLVLSKFYAVADQLHQDRKKDHAQFGESSLHQAIAKLPSSGRNMLGVLFRQESLNQRTIAKAMKISSQAVSETIKKLENARFITRTNGAINNENLILLTKDGKEAATLLDIRIKEHAKLALQPLTDLEAQTLYDLLDKLIADPTDE